MQNIIDIAYCTTTHGTENGCARGKTNLIIHSTAEKFLFPREKHFQDYGRSNPQHWPSVKWRDCPRPRRPCRAWEVTQVDQQVLVLPGGKDVQIKNPGASVDRDLGTGSWQNESAQDHDSSMCWIKRFSISLRIWNLSVLYHRHCSPIVPFRNTCHLGFKFGMSSSRTFLVPFFLIWCKWRVFSVRTLSTALSYSSHK